MPAFAIENTVQCLENCTCSTFHFFSLSRDSGNPKLTESSVTIILLQRKFESGELNWQDGPKSVWESELAVRWPGLLVDMHTMRKKWLLDETENYEDYHQEIAAFQEHFRKVRTRATDWIESNTRIGLEFLMETHIHHKHILTWRRNSTKLVNIRLKVVVEQYAIENHICFYFELSSSYRNVPQPLEG